MRVTPPEGIEAAFECCEDCGGTGTFLTTLLGVPLMPDPESPDPLVFVMPAPEVL